MCDLPFININCKFKYLFCLNTIKYLFLNIFEFWNHEIRIGHTILNTYILSYLI